MTNQPPKEPTMSNLTSIPALGDAHRYAVTIQCAGTTVHLGPYNKPETAEAVYAAAQDLAAHTDSVIVELVPSYYLPGTAKAQAKAAVSAVFPGLEDAMAANAAAAAKANAEAEKPDEEAEEPVKAEEKTPKAEEKKLLELPTPAKRKPKATAKA